MSDLEQGIAGPHEGPKLIQALAELTQEIVLLRKSLGPQLPEPIEPNPVRWTARETGYGADIMVNELSYLTFGSPFHSVQEACRIARLVCDLLNQEAP